MGRGRSLVAAAAVSVVVVGTGVVRPALMRRAITGLIVVTMKPSKTAMTTLNSDNSRISVVFEVE